MKISLGLLTIFAMFWGNQPLLLASEKRIEITEIEPEETAEKTYIHIQLSQAPNWKSRLVGEAHETFVQVNLEGVEPGFPGKFWDVGSKTIEKVAVFQVSDGNSAIRIFPKPGIKVESKHLNIETLGSRIIASIEHKGPELLQESSFMGPPFIPDGKKQSIEQKDIGSISTTSPINSVPEEAASSQKQLSKESPTLNLNKESQKTWLEPEETQNNTDESKPLLNILIKIALFLAGLIVVSLGFLTKRKFALLKALDMEKSEIPQILNLSSLSLSQKQKLSLIQIGNERFLIGVSPSEIRMLTEIGKSKKSDQEVTSILTGKRQALEGIRPEKFSDQLGIHEDQKIKVEKASPHKVLEPIRKKPQRTPEMTEKRNTLMDEKVNTSTSQKSAPKIRISVGDDGIKNLSPRQLNSGSQRDLGATSSTQTNRVVDDVTKLLRERISGLKSI